MYHIFCIHSSVEEHLGSFQLLAIINKAAMEHVSFLLVGTSSGYIPTARLISRMVVQACNPTNNGGVVPLSPHPLQHPHQHLLSPKLERNQMSFSRGMDTENVVNLYNGTLTIFQVLQWALLIFHVF